MRVGGALRFAEAGAFSLTWHRSTGPGSPLFRCRLLYCTAKRTSVFFGMSPLGMRLQGRRLKEGFRGGCQRLLAVGGQGLGVTKRLGGKAWGLQSGWGARPGGYKAVGGQGLGVTKRLGGKAWGLQSGWGARPGGYKAVGGQGLGVTKRLGGKAWGLQNGVGRWGRTGTVWAQGGREEGVRVIGAGTPHLARQERPPCGVCHALLQA